MPDARIPISTFHLTPCCFALVIILLTTLSASAQGFWGLENRGYYDPLIAEPRAAQISITAPGISDEFPFMQKPGRRAVWDVSLGKEIPIVGYETSSGKGKPLGKGKWGIGFWLPVSFHMIEDFKDPSAPILNTDYRFSAMLKAQRGLSTTSRLGFRFQVGHESTHIGDEFALEARRTKPDFERVNVSYEYWEYGISFETDRGKSLHRLVFRHGGIGLLNPQKGFYEAESLEPGGRILPRSAKNFEPSFGFQWYFEKEKIGKFGPFLSIDSRYKTIYDYRKANDAVAEDRQMSFNILFGIRRVQQRFLEKGVPDLFFRYYRGVNPAGQFRSQRDYQLIGFGIYVPL
jgi:hypothetical protein